MVDFTQLIGGAVSGGDFTTLLTGAASNPIGTALGFFGGPALDGIGALLGHQKTDVSAQDAAIATIAATNVMSVEDAGKVVAWQANHSKDRFNDLAIHLATPGEGQAYFLRLVAKYNSEAKPATPVRPGSAQGDQYTRGGIGVPYADAYTRGQIGEANALQTSLDSQFQALVNQTNVNAMQNAAPAQAAAAGTSLVDQLKAILQGAAGGAKAGAATAAANTPYGQQATKETINSYIKDYQLPIAAAAIGLAFVFKRAFSK